MSVDILKKVFGQVLLKDLIKLFAGLTFVYVLVDTVYLLYFHPYAKFPGPKLAAVSNTWYAYHWLTGRYPWAIEAAVKKYGDVVRIGPNEAVFFNVQGMNDILLGGTKQRPVFRKSNFYFRLGPHTGISAEPDPETHRITRKWMAPAFSPRALKEQDPVLHRVIDNAVNKMALRGNQPGGLNMTLWSDWIACDLAGSLGHDYGNVEKEKTSTQITWFNNVSFWVTVDQVFKRIPLLHPLVYLIFPLSLIRLVREHKRIIGNRVKQRNDYTQRDYLTSLISDARPLPNQDLDWLLAQARDIFIGGIDPDTNLFWAAILLLTQHPDKLQKLTDETRNRFKRYADIEDEQLVHLPWLHGVIEEALRLHPSGSFGQPRVSPGATVDGHYIPAGCGVQTCFYAAFHSERYWHQPRSFCPERWLPVTDPDYNPAFADDVRDCFRPFSAGNRNCIGQTMGYRQARVLLAKMAWQLDWELVNDIDWEPQLRLYAIYQRPDYFVRYKLSDVAKAAAAEMKEKGVMS